MTNLAPVALSAAMSAPYAHVQAITPNDGANLAKNTRALMCALGGVIKIDTVGGDVGVVFTAIAGFEYRIRCQKVYATGTAATGIIGLS